MRHLVVPMALVILMMATSWSLGSDQQIAQAIMQQLRQHQDAGRLKGFDIDLSVDEGRVTLTGNVSNIDQHKLAIGIASRTRGVKLVINDLKVNGLARNYPGQIDEFSTSTAGRRNSSVPKKDQLAKHERAKKESPAKQSTAKLSQPSGLLGGLREALRRSHPVKPASAETETSDKSQPNADLGPIAKLPQTQPETPQASQEEKRESRKTVAESKPLPQPVSQSDLAVEEEISTFVIEEPQTTKPVEQTVAKDDALANDDALPKANWKPIPKTAAQQPAPQTVAKADPPKSELQVAKSQDLIASQPAQNTQPSRSVFSQPSKAMAKAPAVQHSPPAAQQTAPVGGSSELNNPAQPQATPSRQPTQVAQLPSNPVPATAAAQTRPVAAHYSDTVAQAAGQQDTQRVETLQYQPTPEIQGQSTPAIASAIPHQPTPAIQPTAEVRGQPTPAAQPDQPSQQQQAALMKIVNGHIQGRPQGHPGQPILVAVMPHPSQMHYGAPANYGRPVAFAPSSLPGAQGQARQAMQRPMQPPVQLVQAMQAQQMQPQPQFIQSTGQGAIPARYDHPHMPGYAWPSYASYPNYASLQYPTQHEPHAWPYIGPYYPYPQVPLGWRHVTLEWDDGWWFLDFSDNGRGPYITR